MDDFCPINHNVLSEEHFKGNLSEELKLNKGIKSTTKALFRDFVLEIKMMKS